ncbi:PREDICTED: ATP-dependent DNA helicase RecQ-like [Acropora digitifera]|uniref:ATP-dependent DNA helicase RecQ-like n=1 Tax=Acropora digitifera TaxID=70779 RepID=UPI00077A3C6D|nr:PREDICTED: ATP-dependent DNA helicase RecQ-like [Acropora digitifera]
MADLMERDMEANFEHILKEILLELKDKSRKITLKDEQSTAVKQLYGKKENRNPNGHSQTASVLVICPLTSIINDQIMEVESMGLSGCNLLERLADLTDLEGGKYHIVYSSGESALDKRFLQSLKKNNVFSRRTVACVVDESHMIETWTEIPFPALTGTADADTCSVIISTLCLKDPLMVHVSPNRNNLRFAIIKTKKDAMFAELDWLVHHIKGKGDLTDKTIVFCSTRNDIPCVVNYLMMKLGKHAYSRKELCEQPNCLIGIYHSSSWPHCKNRIVQSFQREGKVRVVVASSALSMGVNCPDIRYILNWGPARSLS